MQDTANAGEDVLSIRNELVGNIDRLILALSKGSSLERAECLTGLHHRSERSEHEINAFDALNQSSALNAASRAECYIKPEQWLVFRTWLEKNYAHKSADDRLRNARKFYPILFTGDAAPLAELSEDKSKHAMKSLAVLARFLGKYDEWTAIKKRYNLKWAKENAALKAFEKIASEEQSIDKMLAWLRLALRTLPAPYGGLLKFNVLTGLRPAEAVLSVRLLSQEAPGYLNSEKATIEHYRLPKLFIRKTKKAFISLATPEVLEAAQVGKGLSYQAMQCKIHRAGLPMNMEYCRQIYATYLRNEGVTSEIVDLLQGRLPASVFLRHYYRPNFKEEIDKVRCLLYQFSTAELQQSP